MKSLKDLIDLPTEEEMKEIAKKVYENNKKNPNNFSNWFYLLSTALNSRFLSPRSACVELPFELREEILKDYNFVTDEAKQQLFNFVLSNEFARKIVTDGTFFLKTGIFSNKFDFNASCKVGGKGNLFENFYAITYAAALYSANHTNEVVVREYIEDVEQRKTIYNGMPLRTEFRVFYDFDQEKVLGISNYWHPDVMIKGLMPYVVREVFEKITDIEQQKIIAKKVIEHEQKEHIEKAFDDYFNYLETMDLINNEFDSLKVEVARKVTRCLQGKEVLTGAWSIDIMKNGDDFYFIDAAIMRESALVEQMEVVEV